MAQIVHEQDILLRNPSGAVSPKLVYGDADTYLYESADDVLDVFVAGSIHTRFNASGLDHYLTVKTDHIGEHTAAHGVVIDNELNIAGTDKLAGYFYAGTTDPSNSTRLNYDGNLYVTSAYFGGANSYHTFTMMRASNITIGSATESYVYASGTGGLFIYPTNATASLFLGANSTKFVELTYLGTLKVGVINEYTASAGVTIEGVKLIDSYVTIAEVTAPAGTPSAGTGYFYSAAENTVGKVFFKNDDGTVFDLTKGAALGASVSSSWRFNTATTNADPGSKQFKLNNAAYASVTAIYINDTTLAGNDSSGVFSLMPVGARLYIQQANDASKIAMYDVSAKTDNTGWWTLTVTYVGSTGTLFTSNAECGMILYSASGTTPVDSTLLDWSTDRYQAYSARGSGGEFFTGTDFPNQTNRLNYNGNLYLASMTAGTDWNNYSIYLLNQVQITIAATARLDLYPAIADTGSNVAYMFDTANALTSGRKIMSFKNNGTEKTYIDYNGDIYKPAGSLQHLTISAGNASGGAGTDAGNLTLKAGNSIGADSGSTEGKLYLIPGNPYTATNGGFIYFGHNTLFSGQQMNVNVDSTETTCSLTIAQKGATSMSLGNASTTANYIRGTYIGLYGEVNVGNDVNGIVRGYDGATGRAITVRGGTTSTASTAGGHVYIYGGTPGAGGTRGGIYFGDGSTVASLPAKGAETNVVYYDTTTGKLSYGVASGGTTPVDSTLLDWSTDRYQPYSTAQSGGEFYTGTGNPAFTTRLNYDGAFYATNLYAVSVTLGFTAADATIISTGITMYSSSVAKMNLTPGTADSGSNIAYTFDTINSLTSGRKLLSVKNATVEKFYIDYNGDAYANGTKLGGGGVTLSGTTNDCLVTVTGANALQAEGSLKFNSSYELNLDGGKMVIGTTLAPAAYFDICWSPQTTTASMVIGADSTGTTTRTNATTKSANITGFPYGVGEEKIQLLAYEANSTASIIYVGGGSSNFNAATRIVFYTDAKDTVTGTERLSIESTGEAIFAQQIRAANGSASTPSIAFTNSTDTGFFRQADHVIGVGIGGSEYFRFESNGDFHAEGDIKGNSTTVSDIRLKDNIVYFESALEKILRLRGISYTGKYRYDGWHTGYSAQDMEQVIPHVVVEKPMLGMEGLYKTIRYQELIPYITEGMKEQNDMIRELQKEVQTLKEKLYGTNT